MLVSTMAHTLPLSKRYTGLPQENIHSESEKYEPQILQAYDFLGDFKLDSESRSNDPSMTPEMQVQYEALVARCSEVCKTEVEVQHIIMTAYSRFIADAKISLENIPESGGENPLGFVWGPVVNLRKDGQLIGFPLLPDKEGSLVVPEDLIPHYLQDSIAVGGKQRSAKPSSASPANPKGRKPNNGFLTFATIATTASILLFLAYNAANNKSVIATTSGGTSPDGDGRPAEKSGDSIQTLTATASPTTQVTQTFLPPTHTMEPPKKPHELAPNLDTDQVKYKVYSSEDGRTAWYVPDGETQATIAFDTVVGKQITPEDAGRRVFITPDGQVLEVEYVAPVTITLKDGGLKKDAVTFSSAKDFFDYIFLYRQACYSNEELVAENGLTRSEQAEVYRYSIRLTKEGREYLSDISNSAGTLTSMISFRQKFTPEGKEIVVGVITYPVDPKKPYGENNDLTEENVEMEIIAYNGTWEEFFGEMNSAEFQMP